MKHYRYVLTILIKNSFRNNGGGNSKISRWVVMALAFSPLIALMCVMLSSLTHLAAERDLLAELINIIYFCTQTLIFFFAVQSLISALYLAEDSQFLSSLPIKPRIVFFARLSQIYLGELLISALILLPSLLTIAITCSANGYAIFSGFYPLILLLTFLAPLLPLALGAILSMPLMWVASFLKRRASFTSFVSIFLYCALFVVYFLAASKMQSVFDTENLSASTVNAFRSMLDVLYPNKVLILMCLGIEGGKNFGITLAIWGGALALMILLASLFYGKATASQTESQAKTSDKAVKFQSRNVITALMIKDVKMLVRFPTLALSCASGIIIAPILLIVTYLMPGDDALIPMIGSENLTLNANLILVGLIFVYTVAMGAGLNMPAMMAFTREGQTFFISKHLPVSPKDHIISKIYLAQIVSAIAVLPIVLLAIFLMKVNVVSALLFGIVMMLICFGMNCFSIMMDMRRPNLDWKITSEIQRNNAHMIIPFIVAMVVAVAMLVLAIVFATLDGALGSVVAEVIFWIAAFVLGGLIAVGGGLLLKHNAAELYAKMGTVKISTRLKNKQNLFNKNNRNKGGMLG